MTERNEPCPCGSGKKYKNCCGKNVIKGGCPMQIIFGQETYMPRHGYGKSEPDENEKLVRRAQKGQQFVKNKRQ